MCRELRWCQKTWVQEKMVLKKFQNEIPWMENCKVVHWHPWTLNPKWLLNPKSTIHLSYPYSRCRPPALLQGLKFTSFKTSKVLKGGDLTSSNSPSAILLACKSCNHICSTPLNQNMKQNLTRCTCNPHGICISTSMSWLCSSSSSRQQSGW
jgi:hypothetical protein